MRYITEAELREQFAGGIPQRYDLPADCRLTPAARQHLMDLKLYRKDMAPRRVDAAGAMPSAEKPESMTHLTASDLVRKDHPRIALRGKLDSLESAVLLEAVRAQKEGNARLKKQLDDALGLIRRILAADFKEAPLGEWMLDGMTAQQVRAASHTPRLLLPEGHPLPCAQHGETAARLNRLRTQVREAEVCAVGALCGEGRDATDLILALNRLSSYFYVLQLQAVADARRES